MEAPLADEALSKILATAENFSSKSDIDPRLPVIVAQKRDYRELRLQICNSLQGDKSLFRHGEGLVSVANGKMEHYMPDTMLELLSSRANYVDKKGESMFPPDKAAKNILVSTKGDDGIRPLERIANVPSR
jgi:hypothetical protein